MDWADWLQLALVAGAFGAVGVRALKCRTTARRSAALLAWAGGGAAAWFLPAPGPEAGMFIIFALGLFAVIVLPALAVWLVLWDILRS